MCLLLKLWNLPQEFVDTFSGSAAAAAQMHIYISPGYFVRGDMSGMRMMQSISVLTHLWTLGVRVRVKLENLGRTKNQLIGISVTVTRTQNGNNGITCDKWPLTEAGFAPGGVSREGRWHPGNINFIIITALAFTALTSLQCPAKKILYLIQLSLSALVCCLLTHSPHTASLWCAGVSRYIFCIYLNFYGFR